ncbi:hypothetical protein KQI88_09975 [Alkaliphilus sp. MSJ-5]|uniref:Phage protein n=1 Tax=Alkaliphilus flagellatus TaxID=2841507 RepID=A0ABS6G2N6_9FIRM|nr:hypothetical protein [Alkaliphilus flagellatus]MBU5676746.1 hypothetical protein [Alkaliphilus flagellatus]
MAKKKNGEITNTLFAKEQILRSKSINYSRDVLSILLEEEKTYSLDEVNDLVKKFKERKVK